MADSSLSIAGTPPAPMQTGNVFTWAFSNPFSSTGSVCKLAPTQETQSHHIPTIRGDRPLLVDTESGTCSHLDMRKIGDLHGLGTRITWQQTRDAALRLAVGVNSLNLRDVPYRSTASTTQQQNIGPIVLVHLPNCAVYAPILFGLFASRYAVTLAGSSLTAAELATIVSAVRPQLIISHTKGQQRLAEALNMQPDDGYQCPQDNIFFVEDSKDYSSVFATPLQHQRQAAQDWTSLLAEKPTTHAGPAPTPQEAARCAVILWSSGTSGQPKGVVLSHHALIMSQVALWHANLSFNHDERWLGFVPFNHVFGLSAVLLAAPCIGATLYVMPKFDATKFLSHIPTYKITCLHMAPPIALLLSKVEPSRRKDFASVRNTTCGGAPAAWETILAVYERLGVGIRLGYGLSEMGGGVCNQPDSLDREAFDRNKGNTGEPLYGVQLKITDVNNRDAVLARGKEGRILIRSESRMSSYFNNEEATREAVDKDGWFDSGDLGMLDANGLLSITGRLKEMIKVQGFQVSPVELEEAILGVPGVADAAVAGIFDNRRQTEVPRAYVVPKDASVAEQIGRGILTPEMRSLATDVKQWIEGRSAHYKWLKGGILIVQKIPKSSAGKIQRRELLGGRGVLVDIYPPVAKDVQPKL